MGVQCVRVREDPITVLGLLCSTVTFVRGFAKISVVMPALHMKQKGFKILSVAKIENCPGFSETS